MYGNAQTNRHAEELTVLMIGLMPPLQA